MDSLDRIIIWKCTVDFKYLSVLNRKRFGHETKLYNFHITSIFLGLIGLIYVEKGLLWFLELLTILVMYANSTTCKIVTGAYLVTVDQQGNKIVSPLPFEAIPTAAPILTMPDQT